ncbi:MAG TPA: ABC transporter permease [Gemmatimonadaceae bacterium]|nr:ABC transporter permease [Gemmatimonadaceae bacterium]
MERFLQDLRYSLRVLRQQRAFTFAAVAALALGIGATTAVFSVVDAILLRPFPYPDPDRIVFFMNTYKGGGSGPAASPAKFAFWQQSPAVRDVSAMRTGIANFTGGDTPEQVNLGQVSAAYFRLLGARTLLGRTFSAEEDRPGGARVAVLSHGWWSRRFGSDPKIVGKTISLSGDPYVVIGVIAPGFDPSEFGDSPDVWTPFQLDPNSNDQGHYFMAAGRLAPGVTLQQGKARVAQSTSGFQQKFPDALGEGNGFSVERVQDVFIRNSKSLLTVLLAAVAGVLLIACANVANLLLVRATARKREMAIRAAIGADRSRIVRQLMTESVLLSVIGGVLGLGLGLVGIRWLLSINTAGLPRVGEGGSLVHLDWRVAAFTAAVSIGTGLLFGVVPALHASREDLNSVLRESSGSAGGGRHNRLRSTLVVLEVALALTLVIGSGLLIRTSLALRAVPPGFDAHNVLTMRMSFAGQRFQTSSAVQLAIHDGIERLRALPGVVTASASCCLPLEGGFGLPFKVVGRPLEKGPWHGGGSWTTISPGYFDVFKIPVLRGRAFTDRDDQASTPVVIINESMAKQYWKTSDPLTDRLTIGRGIMREFATEPDRQIIGVVADSRDNGLNQDPGPKMFIPQAQVPDAVNQLNAKLSPLVWVIRTKVPPMSLNAAVQAQLRQATALPVSDVRTMDEVVSRSTSREQFNALLMTIFAISALTLAAIGIYGVMAYAVQQRTLEIGVRLALGAEPGAVRTMVVLQGMRLAITGVVIGVAAAFALSRYMSSLLFGVQSRDPLVFLGVPLLLAIVALLAVWIPAGRASRIDPLGALRSA